MSFLRFAFTFASFAFCAAFAIAQPADGKGQPPSLIVKLDAASLPDGARLRLGKLSGHRYAGPFSSATISRDAKLLGVVSPSIGSVDILDIATGKLVQQLKTQVVGSIAGMAFSPDAKLLALESFGQDLRVWEVSTGKQVQQFQHKNQGGGPRQMGPSFSHDGKIICIGTERFAGKENQGEVKAWEIATGKVIGPFSTIHNYNIRAIVAPDGKTMINWGQLLSRGGPGGNDREVPRTIQVWDLATGKEARQIKLDFGPQGYGNIIDAAFSPDCKTLAVTTGMSTFHLFDYQTGQESRRFSGLRGGAGLRYSPDGQILAAYDMYNGNLQAWNVTTGKRLELADGPKAQLLGIGFPGNNRVTALGNLSQSLLWWDATADEKTTPFEGHLTPVVGLTFTPDGKSLITAGTDHRLFWWNAQTGKEERELRLNDDDSRYGGGGATGNVVLAPNARLAATLSNAGNGGVRLWNLKTGRVICDFEGPRGYSNPGIAFSFDSTKIAAPGTQFPFHVWNIQTGQEFPKMPADKQNNFNGNGNSRAAFSPDGKTVAVHLQSYDRFTGQPISDLILWDLVNSKEMHRLKVPMINAGNVGGSGNIAFSGDSHFLAVSDGAGAITLFNVATGREWRQFNSALRNSGFQFAFSPDGRFLAAGASPRFFGGVANVAADDPNIEIWELASGLRRDQWRGHTAAITGLAYSPDGATLASTSMDTTAILWDLTGKSGPKVSPIDGSEMPAAWKSLVGNDPAISMTMRRMVNAPEPTIAFLSENFLPIKGEIVEDKTLNALVKDLDSSNFKTRALATKELTRLGERAEPALKRGLAGTGTLEARRRLQDVLATIVRHEYSPGELQAVRGVEILERIGTPQARQWLTTLSQGDPIACTTREATAAVKRMARD